MPWFKVDDTLALHPKVVQAGNAAMGLWIRAGSWASQHLTDGFIPDYIVTPLGGNNGDAEQLVVSGLWIAVDGGWMFHDWHKFQPSAAETRAKREEISGKRSAAGRAGGRPRKGLKQKSKTKANEKQNESKTPDGLLDVCFETEKQNESPVPVPVPVPQQQQKTSRPTPIPADAETDHGPKETPDHSTATKIANHLADWIERNGSRKPTITKTWITDIERMHRIDGRTWTEITAAIDWSQQDPFWAANILSPAKLRSKYDQMRLKASAGRSQKRTTDDKVADAVRLSAALEAKYGENKNAINKGVAS